MTELPTWGVVATVAEPAPLIQAFVAHHRALGAAEVHLYFDDPRDPTADLLDGAPGIFVTRCDRVWWKQIKHGVRPKRQNNRQTVNATHAQSCTNVDFLLHCDADEFLRPDAPVVRELTEVPPEKHWMKIMNLERAFEIGAPRTTIFDGVFKCWYPGDQTTLRRGSMTPFGFTGHAAGKTMARVKSGMNLGIHVPRWGHIKERVVPRHYRAGEVELVHFDGLTPLHWAAKFVRQAATFPTFLTQLPDFRIAQSRRIFEVIDDPAALLALYNDVNGYTSDEIATLVEEGDMLRDQFDLDPALRAAFPGQHIDLSPEHFDELLLPRVDRWLRMARRNGVL